MWYHDVDALHEVIIVMGEVICGFVGCASYQVMIVAVHARKKKKVRIYSL